MLFYLLSQNNFELITVSGDEMQMKYKDKATLKICLLDAE